MKKILSLILALLMIVSCASFIFAEDAVTATAAADETASAYYDAVRFLCDYKIMHGKGDTLGVYDDIKRYEMALFVGRLTTGWVDDDAWEDGPENKSQFTDLVDTAAEKYYGAISYVANKGIILGVGGNRFAPEAGIKYEDALTMVVRALGYKEDIVYPWGFIEKAVELGLTAGITGVSYTETLKREVVAQIIYNALFAVNADGETYAEKIFGISTKYDVVVITATDGAHFNADGANAPAGYVYFQKLTSTGYLEEETYVATAASFGLEGEHGDELALGYAFKVVMNERATIENPLLIEDSAYAHGTYVTPTAAEILTVDSLELDPVLNRGLNSKSAGKYPIQAFLGNVTVVDKFTTKYLGNSKFVANDGQFMIFVDDFRYEKDGTAYTDKVTLGNLVAVDWATGNILERGEDGNYYVAFYASPVFGGYFTVKDSDEKTEEYYNHYTYEDFLTVGVNYWTYGEVLAYYTRLYDDKGTETEDDDEWRTFDLNALMTIRYKDCYYNVKGVATSAYADLINFDLNGDGASDYGIYDSYRLGYYDYAPTTVLDFSDAFAFEAKGVDFIGDQDNGEKGQYYGITIGGVTYGDLHSSDMLGQGNDIVTLAKEADLSTYDEAYKQLEPNNKTSEIYGYAPFLVMHYQPNIKLKTDNSLSIYSYANKINTGALANDRFLMDAMDEFIWTGNGKGGAYKQYSGKISQNAVWSVEGSSPVVNEDGTYANGWMLYTINPTTAQLKVEENITAYEEGKETYVATGMLRAYSTSKKTITIGDVTFSTSYDELEGNAFQSSYYVDGIWPAGAAYLQSLLNQYVTYVVVDEKIVYVEACGSEDYRFLVVSSFAGISSDGYIVINAWDTADGANKRIRIESCDNWKFGDFFYYGSQNYDKYSDLFTENTLLKILSYNDVDDSYGVTRYEGLRWNDDDDDYINSLGAMYRGKLYGYYRVDGEYGVGQAFAWVRADYRYAVDGMGIACYRYNGKFRADPNWIAYNEFSYRNSVPGGNGSWTDPPATAYGLSKNLTTEDKYIFIFAPGQVPGSPIRTWEGLVTDPTWSIIGWRMLGTPANINIYIGCYAKFINGFDIDKTGMNHSYVMIPDYKHNEDLGSWFLPCGITGAGWQIIMGYDSRYDGSKDGGDYWPWGKVMNAAYDSQVAHEDWYLLGDTESDYCVLDLVTMKTKVVTAKNNMPILSNRIYEVIDDKIVSDPIHIDEFYAGLIGNFGHYGVDLSEDSFELFTTNLTINNQYTGEDYNNNISGNLGNYLWKEVIPQEINKWLTAKDPNVLGSYTALGTEALQLKWKGAGLATIYEYDDGTIQFYLAGFQSTDGDGTDHYPISANNSYRNHSCEDIRKLLGGNSEATTVTIVNMDRVRLGRNLNPYDGVAAITYVFADSQVKEEYGAKYAKNN